MNPLLLRAGFCCVLWALCIACQKPPSMSIFQAVESGNLKAVKQHVAAKTDLNQLNNAGSAPLHLAVMKGNLEMIEVLSAGGADLNRKNRFGRTPLDVARAKNDTAIVQFIEQKSAKGRAGRGLIDGGLGVSGGMDGF